MNLNEILRQIDLLPPDERWIVLKYTRKLVEQETPGEFEEGMDSIANGETLDLDEAMPELRP